MKGYPPELMRRLSQLRRGAAQHEEPHAGQNGEPRALLDVVAKRHWTEHASVESPPPWQEIETERGPVLHRQLRVPLPAAVSERFPDGARAGAPPAIGSSTAHERVEVAPSPIPAIFIDTETLGLGSQPIILMGLAFVCGTEVWLEQIHARDYSREGALLARSRELLSGAARLVTYNGRSYDLPMIRDRLVRHRLRPLERVPDVDLLHRARRQFGETLPDCRLSTLEFRLMGRNRQGDVRGGDIPRLYHDAVRTEDPTLLGSVFHHNALDLFCLVELVTHLTHGIDDLPPVPRKRRKKRSDGSPEADGAGAREDDTAGTPKGDAVGSPAGEVVS